MRHGTPLSCLIRSLAPAPATFLASLAGTRREATKRAELSDSLAGRSAHDVCALPSLTRQFCRPGDHVAGGRAPRPALVPGLSSPDR